MTTVGGDFFIGKVNHRTYAHPYIYAHTYILKAMAITLGDYRHLG